jgi:hypothetical protein
MSDETETLKTLCGWLWKQCDRTMALTAALRTLLIQRGVLYAEEIDALQAENERTQAGATMEAFAQGLDAYQRELLRSERTKALTRAGSPQRV